jgi:hypothetical protein
VLYNIVLFFTNASVNVDGKYPNPHTILPLYTLFNWKLWIGCAEIRVEFAIGLEFLAFGLLGRDSSSSVPEI